MKNIRFIDSVLKMPFMQLPVRTVIVNINGQEILISPGSKIPSEQYDPKWNISDIVAPNSYHHGGVPKAASIYKNAKLWAVPGLEKKRADIAWTNILDEKSWPYKDQLEVVPLKGMPKMNEFLFVHKESRSLIVTDMCFNIVGEQGFGQRLIMSLFGTYNRFAIGRLFTKGIQDKSAFKKSISKLLSHDFENIIVSHGSMVQGNGKAILVKALAERGLMEP